MTLFKVRNTEGLRARLQVVMTRTRTDPVFDALRDAGSVFIPGMGHTAARVMVVGAVPSGCDVEEGRPFSGAAGMFLEELLAGAGLNRAGVWLSLVHKYEPRAVQPPTFDELVRSKEWLRQEVAVLDPDVVVLFGVLALSTFFPAARMSVVHGRAILTPRRKFVPLSNLATAVGERGLRRDVGRDFKVVGHLADVPRDYAHA